jgi:hypothetical protein
MKNSLNNKRETTYRRAKERKITENNTGTARKYSKTYTLGN